MWWTGTHPEAAPTPRFRTTVRTHPLTRPVPQGTD